MDDETLQPVPPSSVPPEPSMPAEAAEEPLTVVPSDIPAVTPQPETVPPPEPVVPPEHTIAIHTYEDDLSRAMNVSDAKVVQKLLSTARERESDAIEEVQKKKARGWYTVGSIILILVALAAAGYSVYHYERLTVPAAPSTSVGVFPSTPSIVASTTTVSQLLVDLTNDETLTEQKPYLVDLVSDQESQTLLSNAALFSFIGAAPTEPFATALSVIRLGVIKTATSTIPFLIASMPDSEVAVKEFLIAEPTLLDMFHAALGIDITTIAPELHPTFVGEYRYNLPVRALYTDVQGVQTLSMLYATATDTIMVITTEPTALKNIYDTIVRQQ